MRRSPRSTPSPAEEESRARRGLLPRGCYVPSLFGCFDFEAGIRYCVQCPWKNWRPGEWFQPAGDAGEEGQRG